jgi:hypothetical protein
MLAGYLRKLFRNLIFFKMKKLIFLLLVVSFGLAPASAQFLKEAKKLLNSNTKGLSEKDASDGIKEALVNGTTKSVKVVSVLDGYWANPEIKIPFPTEAKEMESRLRAIGLGKKVDEFDLSMNRAAEKAAAEAKPIFIAAIKGMTVKDAIKIVKGEDNAATMYLRNSTSPELKEKFQPIIKSSLDNVSATKYWTDLITIYDKIPLVKRINPDLADYVTDKAIDGLFIMIAKEEIRIRKDPMARTSALLKKVFGN